jgi:hypothetical protein
MQQGTGRLKPGLQQYPAQGHHNIHLDCSMHHVSLRSPDSKEAMVLLSLRGPFTKVFSILLILPRRLRSFDGPEIERTIRFSGWGPGPLGVFNGSNPCRIYLLDGLEGVGKNLAQMPVVDMDARPLLDRVRFSPEHAESVPCAPRSRKRPWNATLCSAPQGPTKRPRHSLRPSKSRTVSQASVNSLNSQDIVNASVSGHAKPGSFKRTNRTTNIKTAAYARRSSSYPCPYTLHNHLATFDCHRDGFTTPASLVDHLVHDHRPRPRCPICRATFPTHAACDRHIVARLCQSSETIHSMNMEGINSTQADKLELVLDWWEYLCQTQQGSDREGACAQWDDCYREICQVVFAAADGPGFEPTDRKGLLDAIGELMDCEDGASVLCRVLDEAWNVVEERGGEKEEVWLCLVQRGFRIVR